MYSSDYKLEVGEIRVGRDVPSPAGVGLREGLSPDFLKFFLNFALEKNVHFSTL